MSEQNTQQTAHADAANSKFEKSIEIVNAALGVLPDLLRFIEERKARSGMTTQEILTRAGARFSDNELNLLADLARLTHPAQ